MFHWTILTKDNKWLYVYTLRAWNRDWAKRKVRKLMSDKEIIVSTTKSTERNGVHLSNAIYLEDLQ